MRNGINRIASQLAEHAIAKALGVDVEYLFDGLAGDGAGKPRQQEQLPRLGT